MKIAGGYYRELCRFPNWNQSYGSGFRAACALVEHCTNIEFYTYAAETENHALRSAATAFHLHVKPYQRTDQIIFDYFHGLSLPRLNPSYEGISKSPPFNVDGSVVIRFGMIEGSAIVKAEKAIYDPQSSASAERFEANGSTANQLAVVLNFAEARKITGRSSMRDIAQNVLNDLSADVVVIKNGVEGAIVRTKTGIDSVPAFITPQVFPIGSGDIFTAFFGYAWGIEGMGARDAAHLASEATSFYCTYRFLPIPTSFRSTVENEFTPFEVQLGNEPPQVYLAGPFFSIQQFWLLEEARKSLKAMGAVVFSPYHDIGFGETHEVVEKDLDALAQSDVVLALLDDFDPGTVFEIGYAAKLGIPIIIYTTGEYAENLKMFRGAGCSVEDDFSTAIYKTAWRKKTR